MMPLFQILSHRDISLLFCQERRNSRNYTELRHTKPFNQAQVDYAISIIIALITFSPLPFINDLGAAKADNLSVLDWTESLEKTNMIQCLALISLRYKSLTVALRSQNFRT
jgi:hypothetical protein